MIYIVWAISLIVAFLVGYKFNKIEERIDVVEKEIKLKIDKPSEEPKSFLVDVDDPVQEAQFEHERLMSQLNKK